MPLDGFTTQDRDTTAAAVPTWVEHWPLRPIVVDMFLGLLEFYHWMLWPDILRPNMSQPFSVAAVS